MAITKDDFAKIWASTSPLTPYSFSDSNYQEGWNFIGSTPPNRQMWDFLQKLTDEKLQYIYDNMIPTGVVQAFAGSTTPTGWLLCDGSAVSRTDYAELYSVIGDTYGAGDGTTTFNLPNLADRFIQGNATAGLPNIKGEAQQGANAVVNTANSGGIFVVVSNGALKGENDTDGTTCVQTSAVAGNANKRTKIVFDASASNTIYGNSNTVQPPAITMRYIIKY